jgi:flagellar basal body-associated protein FliL
MKKTIIIIAVLVVVGILGFVAYSFLASSKVPQAFIDGHNEVVALEKEAFQLSDLTSMPEMEALNAQMAKEDYSGALKSVEAAVTRKKDAAAKLDSVDKKLAELKLMLGEITDSKIKAGAEKFIEMSKKENSTKIGYNNLQIQMLEKLETMIGILVKNSKAISAADEKTINDLGQQIDGLKSQIAAAEKEVNDIQGQYKEMEKEFFKLAGLEIAK